MLNDLAHSLQSLGLAIVAVEYLMGRRPKSPWFLALGFALLAAGFALLDQWIFTAGSSASGGAVAYSWWRDGRALKRGFADGDR